MTRAASTTASRARAPTGSVSRRWPRAAGGRSRTGGCCGATTGAALVLLAPKTGRTHQLRVHLRLLGTPVLGDPLYGGKDPRFPGATLMLHAWRLRIVLPGESAAREFRAPLPGPVQVAAAGSREARPRGTG